MEIPKKVLSLLNNTAPRPIRGEFNPITMPHSKIIQQRDYMTDALNVLKDIETIERLITPVDPITAKIMVLDLKRKYVEITSMLFSNLLTVDPSNIEHA